MSKASDYAKAHVAPPKIMLAAGSEWPFARVSKAGDLEIVHEQDKGIRVATVPAKNVSDLIRWLTTMFKD